MTTPTVTVVLLPALLAAIELGVACAVNHRQSVKTDLELTSNGCLRAYQFGHWGYFTFELGSLQIANSSSLPPTQLGAVVPDFLQVNSLII